MPRNRIIGLSKPLVPSERENVAELRKALLSTKMLDCKCRRPSHIEIFREKASPYREWVFNLSLELICCITFVPKKKNEKLEFFSKKFLPSYKTRKTKFKLNLFFFYGRDLYTNILFTCRYFRTTTHSLILLVFILTSSDVFFSARRREGERKCRCTTLSFLS